jgi:hypothetical protein
MEEYVKENMPPDNGGKNVKKNEMNENEEKEPNEAGGGGYEEEEEEEGQNGKLAAHVNGKGPVNGDGPKVVTNNGNGMGRGPNHQHYGGARTYRRGGGGNGGMWRDREGQSTSRGPPRSSFARAGGGRPILVERFGHLHCICDLSRLRWIKSSSSLSLIAGTTF